MTSEQFRLLKEWLTAPPGDDMTETKRRHAEWILSDSAVYEQPSSAYPPPLTQVGNAAAATVRVVVAAFTGQRITRTPEEQAANLAICHQCEFWHPQEERCGVCGCYGAWKAWLATEPCPKGFWPI